MWVDLPFSEKALYLKVGNTGVLARAQRLIQQGEICMTTFSYSSKKLGKITISCEENQVTLRTKNLEMKSMNHYSRAALIQQFEHLFTNPENVRLFQTGKVWSKESIAVFIERELQNCLQGIFSSFVVSDRQTGNIIGNLKVGYEKDQYAHTGAGHGNAVEIGYLLDKPHWGQGYGTEMTIAAKKYIKFIAYQNYTHHISPVPAEIVATVHPDNSGSVKILSRCLKNKEPQLLSKFNNNPRLFFYKPLNAPFQAPEIEMPLPKL